MLYVRRHSISRELGRGKGLDDMCRSTREMFNVRVLSGDGREVDRFVVGTEERSCNACEQANDAVAAPSAESTMYERVDPGHRKETKRATPSLPAM